MSKFKPVKSQRVTSEIVEKNNPMNIEGNECQLVEKHNELDHAKANLLNTVASNFGRIMNLAEAFVSTYNKKVEAEIDINRRRELREQMIVEADIYIKKMQAQTTKEISKMEVVRSMMSDYYRFGSSTMTVEQFSDFVKMTLENVRGLADE